MDPRRWSHRLLAWLVTLVGVPTATAAEAPPLVIDRPFPAAVLGLVWSDSGGLLALWTESGEVQVRDGTTGQVQAERHLPHPRAVAIGEHAVWVADVHGRLTRWGLADGTLYEEGVPKNESSWQVGWMDVNPTADRLLLLPGGSGWDRGRWALYDAERLTLVAEDTTGREDPYDRFGALSTRAAWAPDGRTFAVQGVSGRVELHAASDGHLLAEWVAAVGPGPRVRFSPDGKALAAYGSLERAALADPGTGDLTGWSEPLTPLGEDRPGAPLAAFAWAPTGRRHALLRGDTLLIGEGGAAPRRVTGLRTGDWDRGHMAWSATGDQILVWSVGPGAPATSAHVVDANSGAVADLPFTTPLGWIEARPDGGALATSAGLHPWPTAGAPWPPQAATSGAWEHESLREVRWRKADGSDLWLDLQGERLWPDSTAQLPGYDAARGGFVLGAPVGGLAGGSTLPFPKQEAVLVRALRELGDGTGVVARVEWSAGGARHHAVVAWGPEGLRWKRELGPGRHLEAAGSRVLLDCGDGEDGAGAVCALDTRGGDTTRRLAQSGPWFLDPSGASVWTCAAGGQRCGAFSLDTGALGARIPGRPGREPSRHNGRLPVRDGVAGSWVLFDPATGRRTALEGLGPCGDPWRWARGGRWLIPDCGPAFTSEGVAGQRNEQHQYEVEVAPGFYAELRGAWLRLWRVSDRAWLDLTVHEGRGEWVAVSGSGRVQSRSWQGVWVREQGRLRPAGAQDDPRREPALIQRFLAGEGP